MEFESYDDDEDDNDPMEFESYDDDEDDKEVEAEGVGPEFFV